MSTILTRAEQDAVWAAAGWSDPEQRAAWIEAMPQSLTGARGADQEVGVAQDAAIWRDAGFTAQNTAYWWRAVGTTATRTAREWEQRGVDGAHAAQFSFWSTNEGGPGDPDLLNWATSGLTYREVLAAYEVGLSPSEAVQAARSGNLAGVVATLGGLTQASQ